MGWGDKINFCFSFFGSINCSDLQTKEDSLYGNTTYDGGVARWWRTCHCFLSPTQTSSLFTIISPYQKTIQSSIVAHHIPITIPFCCRSCSRDVVKGICLNTTYWRRDRRMLAATCTITTTLRSVTGGETDWINQKRKRTAEDLVNKKRRRQDQCCVVEAKHKATKRGEKEKWINITKKENGNNDICSVFKNILTATPLEERSPGERGNIRR